jgi:DNA-binding NtrC family response regulator
MQNNFSILVVDDDKQIRNVYQAILTRKNYRVETASSVADAKEKLSLMPVDLVILDIKMPGGCGDRLVDSARKGSLGSAILCASVFPIEDQKRVIPEADDYFDKSDGLGTLLSKVEHIKKTKEKNAGR